MKVNIPEGKSGPWEVRKFTVTPAEAEIQSMRAVFSSGRGVPAGEYTGLYRGNYVIMSDTPDEIRDHREPISRAKGRCLVNGLGLGMVVAAMLEKKEVDQVVVVEESEDVINLVYPTLQDRYGRRLKVVHADALEYKPLRKDRYDVVWHDIWDNLCVDNLPQMHILHRKYGHKCDWQGSWGRWICEREANLDRNRSKLCYQ